jgi:hypothetical protein
MPVARRSDLVCHIIGIDLDHGLADTHWIANALEPSPDRQPQRACNLRHFYFCPHYPLISSPSVRVRPAYGRPRESSERPGAHLAGYVHASGLAVHRGSGVRANGIRSNTRAVPGGADRCGKSALWLRLQPELGHRHSSHLSFRVTTSAPFSSAAFSTDFKLGSRKSSSATLNLVSSCHSAPGNGDAADHIRALYPNLRSSYLREIFLLSLRSSKHRATVEEAIARIGLPE